MDMRTFTIFIKKYSQIHEFYVVPSVKYTESLYQPIKDFKIREMAGLTISRLFWIPGKFPIFPDTEAQLGSLEEQYCSKKLNLREVFSSKMFFGFLIEKS